MRDVGVVGAGPVGLFAANVLARAGIDCMVFERLAEDAVRAGGADRVPDRAATALPAGVAFTVLAGYAAVLAGAGAALTARREIGTAMGPPRAA